MGRLGWVAAAVVTRQLDIAQVFRQLLIVLLAPHKGITKESQRRNHFTASLVDLRPLFRGCSHKTRSTHLSWDILVTWPNQGNLYLSIRRRNDLIFWVSRTSQLGTLSRSENPSHKLYLCRLHLIYHFLLNTQD